MTNRSPNRNWNRFLLIFSVTMTFLLCISILSASHIELRPIAKDQTKFALDFDHKSTVVKPRPVTSHTRVHPLLLAITLVIFLLQSLSNPLPVLPKLNRFAHVPFRIRRLFLMPVKRTSTAI